MKEASITVRIDPQLKRQLEDIATRSGLEMSSLIRISVTALLKDVAKNDGKLVIPIVPK
jgi:antitoxin component of RelBE/YafQ-DinJ toxin-antitoxin module